MSESEEHDVVHFKTDPGLKKLTEIVGGYFQVVEFPSKPPVFIVMREFNDPGVEGGTFINMKISEMLNCQVRGRVAIIHN